MEDSDRKSFHILKDGKERKVQLFIVVEMFRCLALIWFSFQIFIGMILTVAFTEEDYKKILKSVFGSVNSCVYFDFYPSTYVIPIIYALFPVLVFMYCNAATFRAWISMVENKISSNSFIMYFVVHLYFFLSSLAFAICFSIQPDINNPETIKVHTFPFTNLVLSMMLLHIMIAWFDNKVAMLETNFPKWMKITCFAILIIMIFTTLVKVVIHLNAILFIEQTLKFDENGQVVGNGFIWDVQSHETVNIFFQLVDVVWMMSAVLFPILKGAYLLYRGQDTHGLIITIEDNREGRQHDKDGYHLIESS